MWSRRCGVLATKIGLFPNNLHKIVILYDCLRCATTVVERWS